MFMRMERVTSKSEENKQTDNLTGYGVTVQSKCVRVTASIRVTSSHGENFENSLLWYMSSGFLSLVSTQVLVTSFNQESPFSSEAGIHMGPGE